MSDLSRRQVLRFGAAGAGAAMVPLPWTAAARAASAPPRRCAPRTTWPCGTTRAPARTG
ncbi:twin-arginine translocation signal domain-containing protein [Nonomuraea rubra]|uniref:twin-arginine translocation signal domain-containing protein n=1 Tax=Nonomuraea rubra TaxID=46180 RepID=UPI0036192108